MASPIRQAAEKILKSMQNTYSNPPAMVAADEKNFNHLDLNAYRKFSEDLKAANFRLVGDLEMPELSKSPTTLIERTMIRNAISVDGHMLAVYYQTKPRIGRRIKLLIRGILNLRLIDAPQDFIKAMATRHCVEFETEFRDGKQLITSNAEAAGMMSSPPSIESNFFPYGTPTTVLLERHMKRLLEISKENPPIILQSLDDILQMQKRQSMLKIAYRSSVQWVTQQEMLDMSGGNTNMAEEVFSEIQKIIAEQQNVA